MQELIWKVKPDLIIETGIAHGGSLIFSASMLTLLESCGEIEKGEVLGIDIDIRSHNKKSIKSQNCQKIFKNCYFEHLEWFISGLRRFMTVSQKNLETLG
jgi:cephalosporin hydroxylase